MKLFIVLSVVLVAVAAKPSGLYYSAPATFYTATAPILNQYHSQNELGQYAYGYSGPNSAKVETKSFDGVTRGSYSYIDAEGKLQTVQYTADALNGFNAAATNLPKAPIDNGVAPEQVQDTPEVVRAREEHLAAYNEAAVRAAAEPEHPEAAVDEEKPAKIEFHTAAHVAKLEPVAIAPASYVHTAYHTEIPSSYSYSIQAPAYAYSPYYATAPLHYQHYAPAPLVFAARSAEPVATYEAYKQPEQPVDTPEVAKAKAEHLAAVEEQKARIANAQ